ncbi:hypothetical protein CAPTEDRAFT_207830 [Capitella teleta]|uniref:Uncharacterized protein n=1 Tax=Capitella teleta TaxID=283909 RepID=R7T3J7_CAPTE|nr:hypothetical protein CAPTEDRAFT_207830 [Capitella teleta]|eukprot:ELT87268.1 hypothetical protein CAPTEDRAFT_207830 [Capitella teleta]
MGKKDTGLTDFITWSQIAFGVMAFVKVAKIDITFDFHTKMVCSFAPKFRSFIFTLYFSLTTLLAKNRQHLETDRGAEEPALDKSQQAFRSTRHRSSSAVPRLLEAHGKTRRQLVAAGDDPKDHFFSACA